jgi:hypothetical protein
LFQLKNHRQVGAYYTPRGISHAQAAEAMFNFLDNDGSGGIDRAEFTKAFEARRDVMSNVCTP